MWCQWVCYIHVFFVLSTWSSIIYFLTSSLLQILILLITSTIYIVQFWNFAHWENTPKNVSCRIFFSAYTIFVKLYAFMYYGAIFYCFSFYCKFVKMDKTHKKRISWTKKYLKQISNRLYSQMKLEAHLMVQMNGLKFWNLTRIAIPNCVCCQ